MKLTEIIGDKPKPMMMEKGYYLKFLKDNGASQLWAVEQLMNDKTIAYAFIHPDPEGSANAEWGFRMSGADNDPIERLYVSKSQALDYLKFKWWVTNRLIARGILLPKGKNAN